MSEFKKFAKKYAELRPYEPGETLAGVSISDEDRKTGSPKVGDMVARNPENHRDQWLVNAEWFQKNYVTTPVEDA